MDTSEARPEAMRPARSTGGSEATRPAPRLLLVVPCYNETEVLETTARVLGEKLHALTEAGQIQSSSRVLFVDDGSRDDTWEKITRLAGGAGSVEAAEGGAEDGAEDSAEPSVFSGLKFAHNRGHQNAVYAGMMEALAVGAHCAISLDADLQDDPNAIDEMVAQYRAGSEVVYGVRSSRATDTAFKRGTAHAFYGLMSALGTHTIPDHADFRLLGRAALTALAQYGESNLFLRGIVPDLGFRSSKVFYERAERQAGESKYPLGKMVAFALDGITSFSVTPIRMIFWLGGASFLVALLAAVYTVVSVLGGAAVAGWGSIMLSLWLIGSAVLVSLGIVGEYIGKIYLEVKHRPRYIVEERV
ncbi:glycosyltransferase [Alloscardovia macacae]|uniref:Glycosyltransferase n=2 Tax=Alloscardovia macacae TaxID=1160091 RepID=A0A1Y2SU39_9BIFI|nr:glycosyltransferase [Alloscardovia macacae]OTA28943.1 glycosyltransferase [Alloscardovia macacae]